MPKSMPPPLIDPPPGKPSWLLYFRPILLGLMLSPLVYESTALCVANWRGMAGAPAAVETPVLDAFIYGSDRVAEAIRSRVSALFSDTSWSPSFVIGAGFASAVAGYGLLRRAAG